MERLGQAHLPKDDLMGKDKGSRGRQPRVRLQQPGARDSLADGGQALERLTHHRKSRPLVLHVRRQRQRLLCVRAPRVTTTTSGLEAPSAKRQTSRDLVQTERAEEHSQASCEAGAWRHYLHPCDRS